MPKSISIIGLGYVGLPLAVLCREKSLETKGFDTDKKKIALIREGKSPIKDAWLESKSCLLKELNVSSKPEEVLSDSDVFIIAVPTPAKKTIPDLRPLKQAAETVSKFISKNSLVITESTIYPGTTEEIIIPILEKSGLKAGRDFFIAHCPERIDPGNKKFLLENIPRVLGALTEQGAKKALEFYAQILNSEIILLNNLKEAEAVKVVENTFRDINIAFVNELAKSFDKMNIDLKQVIKGAATKPFGFMPFYPGPGVGGHCIAQDPYYLIARAKKSGFEHKFLKLARQINNSMPEYAVSLLENTLKQKKISVKTEKICILGVSYKPDVDDTRESPALKIIEILKKKKAVLKIFDPLVPEQSNVSSVAEAVAGCSAVVLCTNHSKIISSLAPGLLKSSNVSVLIDTRNCLDKKAFEEKGIIYKGIGS